MHKSHSGSAHLRADGISVSFAQHRVLTYILFTVSAGERAAIIGENGTGKSTLLRVLAGDLVPTSGVVRTSAPAVPQPRMGLLHQEPPFSSGSTISEALEQAVAPVRAAERDLQEAADALAEHPAEGPTQKRYSSALDTAEQLGVWVVDSRVEDTMAGLGLGDVSRTRAAGTLSGGQQARLSLTWLLLNAPDFLLLDEPTNHLDDGAVAYLNTVLRHWRGPVILASHDRAFLNETATTLIDLDPSPLPQSVARPLTAEGTGSGIGVTRFTGSYTEYLHARIDAQQRWHRQYRDEQSELTRLRAAERNSHMVGHSDWKPRTEMRTAAKFYADRNAKVVSRRVHDARRRLERLEAEQIRKPPSTLSFGGLVSAGDRHPQGVATGPLLTAEAMAVEDRLAETSVRIGAGEKWLITGANGSGKSTLLSVLAGEVEPSSGTLTHHQSSQVSLLRQNHELPDPNGRGPGRTALQVYTDAVGRQWAEDLPLGTFGLLLGRDENRPVAELSVGQQRRLALATVLADPPDLLLLDEPTNHFSVLLATQIEAAIPDYPGAVVVASHDRWLRRTWSGHCLELSPCCA